MEDLLADLNNSKIKTPEEEYQLLIDASNRCMYGIQEYSQDLLRFRRYERGLEIDEYPYLKQNVKQFFILECTESSLVLLQKLSENINNFCLEYVHGND